MGIRYMTVYGWPKTEGSGTNEGVKAFENYAKALKKHKCKLLFWCGSFGVPEPVMCTIEFDDIKDWETAGPELQEAFPLTKTRTVFGWDYRS